MNYSAVSITLTNYSRLISSIKSVLSAYSFIRDEYMYVGLGWRLIRPVIVLLSLWRSGNWFALVNKLDRRDSEETLSFLMPIPVQV